MNTDKGCCQDDGCHCVENVVDEAVAEVEEELGSIETPPASARGGVERVMSRVNKADGTKLGRNDKCPCNSGKKFKKCCWELLNG